MESKAVVAVSPLAVSPVAVGSVAVAPVAVAPEGGRLGRLGRVYWRNRETNRNVARAICRYVVETIFEGPNRGEFEFVDFDEEFTFWAFEYSIHEEHLHVRHEHLFTDFQRGLLRMRTAFVTTSWMSFAAGDLWRECQQYADVFYMFTTGDYLFAPVHYHVEDTPWDGGAINMGVNIMLEYNNVYSAWKSRVAKEQMCCIGPGFDSLFLRRTDCRVDRREHSVHCKGVLLGLPDPKTEPAILIRDEKQIGGVVRNNEYLVEKGIKWKERELDLLEDVEDMEEELERMSNICDFFTNRTTIANKHHGNNCIRTIRAVNCYKIQTKELIEYTIKERNRIKVLNEQLVVLKKCLKRHKQMTNSMRKKMDCYKKQYLHSNAYKNLLLEELELIRVNEEVPARYIQAKLKEYYKEEDIEVALTEMRNTFKKLRPYSYKEMLKTSKLMLESMIQDKVVECYSCKSPLDVPLIQHRTLVCGHTFHKACLDKWFEDHTKCPMCSRLIIW